MKIRRKLVILGMAIGLMGLSTAGASIRDSDFDLVPDLGTEYVTMDPLLLNRIEDGLFDNADADEFELPDQDGSAESDMSVIPWAEPEGQLEWVDNMAMGNVVLPAGTRFQVIDRVIDAETRSRFVRLRLDSGFSFWTPLEDIDFANYIPAIQLASSSAFDFRISSTAGWRIHPVLKYCKLHNGIDYAAPSGTPVPARGSGTVSRANRSSSFGNVVAIDHGDGSETVYAHLSKILVKSGQKVENGQIVGKVGSTGRSTGPHLHFERNRIGGASLLAMTNSCSPRKKTVKGKSSGKRSKGTVKRSGRKRR